MRRLLFVSLTGFTLVALAAATFQILLALSPRNAHRPALRSKSYIILHTTEGAAAGALSKLRRNGEAHYLVTRKGQIYRLIEDNRLAKHAGRSMWNGRRNVDEVSLGIETEGYHNRPMTSIQEQALAFLLRTLKARYRIPDVNILTHSMVAYGAPNRWHPHPHRGRKRCGMLMADPAVRRRLGIGPGPSHDPDVDQRRLVIGDRYLYSALFDEPQNASRISEVYTEADANVISARRSAWFIAREKYNSPHTVYTFPNGRVYRGNQIREWDSLPEGTRVTFARAAPAVADNTATDNDDEDDESARIQIIGQDGSTAYKIAGADYARETTIYFLPNGKVRTGARLAQDDPELLNRLPRGTGMLVGYVYGGYITDERSALSIAGDEWNSPATFYRFPGTTALRLVSGDEVDSHRIRRGTLIFFAR